jgi:hypothetical protein
MAADTGRFTAASFKSMHERFEPLLRRWFAS